MKRLVDVPLMGGIHVSGTHSFTETRWREAILFFVFGILSERREVLRNPMISFFGHVIKLERSLVYLEGYRLSEDVVGIPDNENITDLIGMGRGVVIHTTHHLEPNTAVVFLTLIKFAKCSKVRVLLINFGGTVWFRLQKGEKRGELEVRSNLPVRK